jgi:hypothetical protein
MESDFTMPEGREKMNDEYVLNETHLEWVNGAHTIVCSKIMLPDNRFMVRFLVSLQSII